MKKSTVATNLLLRGVVFGLTQLVLQTAYADLKSTPLLSAKHFDHNAAEASPQGRLMIGRGKDYDPIAEDHIKLFEKLRDSMKERRLSAWRVVEHMLQPEKLEIGGAEVDVPRWHTWYEGAFEPDESEVFTKLKTYHADLSSCREDSNCTDTEEVIAERTMNNQSAKKNMVRSLFSENFTQSLGQTREVESLNPEDTSETLGQGFTLFSPSFVKHVLLQSERIVRCNDVTGDYIPADKEPPSADQFSHCIDEFPRSAVMVKTSWVPIDPGSRVEYHDTTPVELSHVLDASGAGTWDTFKGSMAASPSNIYSVETTTGDQFGLQAIHFSTKDVREWLWVSLWWHPDADGDFGADRPSSIDTFNIGVWANYKMCVTSAFKEGDKQPWSSYRNSKPKLATVLKSVYNIIEKQAATSSDNTITTWCSNPILEWHSRNARTNCVGCHQYSNTLNTTSNMPTRFSDTNHGVNDVQYPQFGRARNRKNFPAEFAWSFKHEFRAQIECAIDKTKC